MKILYVADWYRGTITYGYGENGKEIAESIDDKTFWDDYNTIEPYIQKCKEDGDLNFLIEKLRELVDVGFFADNITEKCFKYLMAKNGEVTSDFLEDEDISFDVATQTYYFRENV